MKRLSILEFSTSAYGCCTFDSKKAAAEMFARSGFFGETSLCRAICPDGNVFALWVNKGETGVSFIPVFDLRLYQIDLSFVTLMPLSQTTLLYDKKDDETGVCYAAIFSDDDIILRMMKMLPDQNMVEAYCIFQEIDPLEIYLCKMYTVQETKYVTSCWLVCYQDPNDLDENGEPERYETFLPVDFADSEMLSETSLRSLNNITMKENDVFIVQGQIYKVLKDENGKLFITKKLFEPKKEKLRDVQPLPKEKETEKPKKKCRLIQFRQH